MEEGLVKNIEVKKDDGEQLITQTKHIGAEPEYINIYKNDEGRFVPSTDYITTSEPQPLYNTLNDLNDKINSKPLPAPAFDVDINYKVGDYVTYNGATYKFIEDHVGAWINSHVTPPIYIAGQYVTAGKKEGTILGMKATAEGNDTEASGISSHAEGNNTQASYDYSHAEGAYTTAGGICSHAEGESSIVGQNHNYSHAEGYHTQTGVSNQHVQGRWNIGRSNTLFEIGNGTDNENRSNAFEVDTEGNVTTSGTITDKYGPLRELVYTRTYGTDENPTFQEVLHDVTMELNPSLAKIHIITIEYKYIPGQSQYRSSQKYTFYQSGSLIGLNSIFRFLGSSSGELGVFDRIDVALYPSLLSSDNAQIVEYVYNFGDNPGMNKYNLNNTPIKDTFSPSEQTIDVYLYTINL